MLDTPVAVLAALALLMPGFVIAELALAGSARGPRGDLEIALLEALCTMARNPDGIWTLGQIIEPERGLYVPASQVSHIEVLQPGVPRGAKIEDHD
jgi:hypothetical protein